MSQILSKEQSKMPTDTFYLKVLSKQLFCLFFMFFFFPSCKSMPRSGCAALHRLNSNFFLKKKKLNLIEPNCHYKIVILLWMKTCNVDVKKKKKNVKNMFFFFWDIFRNPFQQCIHNPIKYQRPSSLQNYFPLTIFAKRQILDV